MAQLLLQFQRTDTKITWNNQQVAVPLPAGLALSSPWVDMTHSSPSCRTNAPFDYLPQLQGLDKVPRPSCAAWPANPPRKMLYCADALITHPLITLLTAKSWHGCPPVYISTGWELLSDEDKYLAAKMHADGVPVVFEEYEGMPHCFAMVVAENPMSKRCFGAWAGFIKGVVEDKGEGEGEGAAGGVQSVFRTVKARTLCEEERDPLKVSPYTEEEMWERMSKLKAQYTGARATGDVAAKL